MFTNRGRLEVTGPRFGVYGNDTKSDWGIAGLGATSEKAAPNRPVVRKLTVTLPENAHAHAAAFLPHIDSGGALYRR